MWVPQPRIAGPSVCVCSVHFITTPFSFSSLRLLSHQSHYVGTVCIAPCYLNNKSQVAHSGPSPPALGEGDRISSNIYRLIMKERTKGGRTEWGGVGVREEVK